MSDPVTSDPNWLLTSTAQSAAALVAIVGGFLASRVIAFLSDKQATQRRLRSTKTALESAQVDKAAADEEVREWERNHDDESPPAESGGGIPVGVWSGADAVRKASAKSEGMMLTGWADQSDEKVRQLQSEHDQLVRELDSLSVPQELMTGFAVLTAFALSGVVLPIAIMAVQPITVAWYVRGIVVVGFIGGLAALGWYLWRVFSRAKTV